MSLMSLRPKSKTKGRLFINPLVLDFLRFTQNATLSQQESRIWGSVKLQDCWMIEFLKEQAV